MHESTSFKLTFRQFRVSSCCVTSIVHEIFTYRCYFNTAIIQPNGGSRIQSTIPKLINSSPPSSSHNQIAKTHTTAKRLRVIFWTDLEIYAEGADRVAVYFSISYSIWNYQGNNCTCVTGRFATIWICIANLQRRFTTYFFARICRHVTLVARFWIAFKTLQRVAALQLSQNVSRNIVSLQVGVANWPV